MQKRPWLLGGAFWQVLELSLFATAAILSEFDVTTITCLNRKRSVVLFQSFTLANDYYMSSSK